MTNLFTDMKKRANLLVTFILLLITSAAFAQQSGDNMVSGSFHEATFSEFVQKIEAQTNYHFFYDASQFDSMTITISVSNAHLTSVLDKVFNGTRWRYTIDDENHVFVTKGFSLAADLPYGFFTGKTDTSEMTAKKESENLVYVSQAKKVNTEISVENKLYDIGFKRNETPKGNVNVAGYIRDDQTGESISGALIYKDNPHVQVSSDQFGYYSIILPAGRHTLHIIAPGMFDTKRQVMLYSNGKFDINMDEKVLKLKEVLVEAGKERN